MAERDERRWTLYEGSGGDPDYVAGPPFDDGEDVVPVSEVERLHAELARLRDAAQAALDAYWPPVTVGKLYTSMTALRAVLASTGSEEG